MDVACAKRHLRCQSQILATATGQPAAASSSSCLRAGEQSGKTADLVGRPFPEGKEAAGPWGQRQVAVRGQIRVYETSSPEERRGQKELGGESKHPLKEDQGRVGGGKTARRRVESWGSH